MARNTVLNLVAHAVPLALGLVVIPIVVRGLGPERFGILGLAWALTGYFLLLDLGIGRATTKFVAEAMGRGEQDRIPTLIRTAVLMQAGIGVAGAAVLVAVTPAIVEGALNVPDGLLGEATAAFYVLAPVIPVMLVAASFRGALEAAQRFDLVNAVRMPASSGTLLGPLVGTQLGWDLPAIVGLIGAVQVLAAVAFFLLTRRVFPSLEGGSFRLATVRSLISFGGWVTVPVVVGPVFVYLDRFLIGSFVSLAAVTYYTVPFDMLTRIWIVPASLLATVFPAMSTLAGAGRREEQVDLAARSLRYLLLTMGPVFILIAVNAHPILDLWLGPAFAARSDGVLQILAVGVLVNYLAFVPYTFLQAIGRADVTAKLHLIEAPLYVSLVVWMVLAWGIVGAAAAWLIRAIVDAALVLGAAVRLSGFRPAQMIDRSVVRTLGVLAGFGIVVMAIAVATDQAAVRAVGSVAAAGILALVAWRRVIPEPERRRIFDLARPSRVTS